MGSCQSSTAAAAASSEQPQSTIKQHDDTTTAATTRTTTDSSSHHNGSKSQINPKVLDHAHSSVGLDEIVKERKAQGHLMSNVVHIESVNGRKIQDVYDGVKSGLLLGEGVAGRVHLVQHKATGVKYAVKCLELSRMGRSQETQEALRNEITIMSQLDHHNIARLHEVYEDKSTIYLVQELASGGELFDVLDEQPEYHYGEQDAVRLVYQMLSALRYLHSKDIIHRDLKLENFLFSTERHAELKMIDFGLSKHFNTGEVQHSIVGTPYTVAPEVIKGSYSEECDVFSIGVLAYMLLCGETPFGGCGDDEPLSGIRDNILAGRYSFEPEDVWANVSDEAKDFIRKLLVTNPEDRPSAEQAMQLPWIRAYHDELTKDAIVSSEVIDALVAFKDASVTERLMLEVVSFTMLPEQIRHIRQEFEKMDSDGVGELSLDCMTQVLMRSSASEGRDGLTEGQIKEIFDTCKLGKAEPRLHWHEFIAACLPMCNVDDRNLRVAFERLDDDHNGFITFEEVIQMIARDANEDEDALRKAWANSVEEYHCKQSQFSYEEFCQLVRRHL